MNSVILNNVSLKYHRFASLGSKDIGIINSEFVAKTQFLYSIFFFLPKGVLKGVKSESRILYGSK